jgi:hypothetical protein
VTYTRAVSDSKSPAEGPAEPDEKSTLEDRMRETRAGIANLQRQLEERRTDALARRRAQGLQESEE